MKNRRFLNACQTTILAGWACLIYATIVVAQEKPSTDPASSLDAVSDLFGSPPPTAPVANGPAAADSPTASTPVTPSRTETPSKSLPPQSSPANAKPLSKDEGSSTLRDTKRPYIRKFDEALKKSQIENRPLLVLLGAAWCGWCKVLEADLESAAANKIFNDWIVADIDVDEDPKTGAMLEAAALPAMRIIGLGDSIVARREGYLELDKFQAWLDENRQAADPELQRVLFESNRPNSEGIERLVSLLADRATRVRSAASQRLGQYRDETAPAVIQILRTGRLVQQLSALQILRGWCAPIDGVDPWLPESLSDDVFTRLVDWTRSSGGGLRTPVDGRATSGEPPSLAVVPLDETELRLLFGRLSTAEGQTRRQLIATLASYGAPSVALARQHLVNFESLSDVTREALREVIYSALAGRKLQLENAGTLAALGRLDSETHRQATVKTMENSTLADLPLLEELGTDADPLVRELAVRNLGALGMLTRDDRVRQYLSDPSANVRTAVLNVLQEKKSEDAIKSLCDYLQTETSEDLLVFGAKCLGQMATNKLAQETLGQLAANASWRVRAAVMDACEQGLESRSAYMPSYSRPDAAVSDKLAEAVLKAALDEEPFVAERAIKVLPKLMNQGNAEKIAELLVAFPQRIAAFKGSKRDHDQGQHLRPLAAVGEKWLASNEKAKMANGVELLSQLSPTLLQDRLADLLVDDDPKIRLAALKSAFLSLEDFRAKSLQRGVENRLTSTAIASPGESPSKNDLGSPGESLTRDGQTENKAAPMATGERDKTTPAQSAISPTLDLIESLFGAEPTPPPVEKPRPSSPAPVPSKSVTLGSDLDSIGDLFGDAPAAAASPGSSAGSAALSQNDRALSPPRQPEIPDNSQIWMALWRSGNFPRRPTWIAKTEEVIGKRQVSGLPVEQAWENLVCLALGHEDRARPLLTALQERRPEDAKSWPQIADVLRWLPDALRWETFEERSRARANDPRGLLELFQNAAEIPSDQLSAWMLNYMESFQGEDSASQYELIRLLLKSQIGPIEGNIPTILLKPSLGSVRMSSNSDKASIYANSNYFTTELDWFRKQYDLSHGTRRNHFLLAAIAHLNLALATDLANQVIAEDGENLPLNSVAAQILFYSNPDTAVATAARMLEKNRRPLQKFALAYLATKASQYGRKEHPLVPLVYDFEDNLAPFQQLKAPIPKVVLLGLANDEDRQVSAQAKLLLMAAGEPIPLAEIKDIGVTEGWELIVATALATAKRTDEDAVQHYTTTYEKVKDDYQEPKLLYSLIRQLPGEEVGQLRQRMRADKGSNLFQ